MATKRKKKVSRRERCIDEDRARRFRENPDKAMKEAHEEGRKIREQVRKELEPMTRITKKELDFTVR